LTAENVENAEESVQIMSVQVNPLREFGGYLKFTDNLSMQMLQYYQAYKRSSSLLVNMKSAYVFCAGTPAGSDISYVPVVLRLIAALMRVPPDALFVLCGDPQPLV
jgi:hypothetical protein